MLPFIEESSIRFFQQEKSILFPQFLAEKSRLLLSEEAIKYPIEGFLQSFLFKQAIQKLYLGRCIEQLLKKRPYQLVTSRLLESKTATIQVDHYSIKPLACFFYLQLQGRATQPVVLHPADALFIDPGQLWSLQQEGKALVIAAAFAPCQYIQNGQDPHNPLLKKYGYAFGDRLRYETHPLLK